MKHEKYEIIGMIFVKVLVKWQIKTNQNYMIALRIYLSKHTRNKIYVIYSMVLPSTCINM